ncbi:MAG: UDP-N-acetylmuramoyl-tripeptide--D-alanyl-D-alanine ligase [Spirochaetaceae bacterium]|nr:UDP-N-acetylmuramoyl-tripeptide--D-alanyl-D-alanine ligase [Spirochaetaceae bacterium]
MDRILFTAVEVSGILHSDWIGDPVESFADIQIDSRKCGRGTLFIPLEGERTNGHLYFNDIADRGTMLSLVAIGWYNENRDLVEKLVNQKGLAFLPVSEPLIAMQELASYHMRRFPELTVVGITGSNGKTTTKEILGAILSESMEAVVSEGNFNSDIGLPLSAFRVEENHEVAVFEMGMNRVGEMDLLASIVRPDLALITNIGTAHIGPLGSRKAIAEAKKQVFSCFTGSQIAFIPENDEYRQFLSEGIKGKVILYGSESTTGVKIKSGFSIEGFDLEVNGYPCHFSLPGDFNLNNVLGAVAVALEIGIEPELIARGIGKVEAAFGRGELIKGDVTLLRDCYNANPDSMAESLKLLDYWDSRSIAVLGDMLELGDESTEQHRRIGDLAAKSSAQALFLFGEHMETAFESVKDSGYSGYSFWTSELDSLAEALKQYLKSGDLVLLKGSRSLALERLTDLIVEN